MSDDNNLKVLELFVDSVQTVSKDVDRLYGVVDDLNKKMSTPPRHQELEDDHKQFDGKMDTIISSLTGMHTTIKNGMRIIKVVTGLFGIAILIAVSVITYSDKNVPVKSTIDAIELHKDMDTIKQLLRELGGANEKLEEGDGPG